MTAYVMAHVHTTNFGPEIIEFPSPDSARGWYESPAYTAIRHLRTENTTADTIIFDGLPAGYLAKSALEHALPAT